MNESDHNSQSEKIRLLVIPSAYPENDDDIKGVFVIDYIKSVEKYCEIKVLRATSQGRKPELETVTTYGYSTINYRAGLSFGLPGKKVINYMRMALGSKQLMNELKAFKPDLIHVHGSTMHGLMAKRIAGKLGIPYVVSEHTGPYSKISEHPIFKRMSKYVIEGSARLFSVSKDLEDQILTSGVNPKSKSVTFNPVDTRLFQPEQHTKEFVFVGRYEPYKGALRVLKAFAKIEQQLPDWKLTLIGGGKEFESMVRYSNENSLNESVEIHGQMSKPQIAAILKKAGIFVFPSEHETFGIVIAEGMSCGLPVVAGNRTAPKEFVGAEHGRLVDPTNIDAIAGAMLEMARSINNYDRKLIRQHVESKFGFASFGEKLLAEYRNVIQP